MDSGRYTDDPLRSFLAADPWGEDPLPHLQEAEWSLCRCDTCGQMFHRNILDEEWNERRFSQWMSAEAIDEFERRNSGSRSVRNFNSGIAHVTHIMRLEQATAHSRQGQVRLLDFGCGSGEFLEACLHFGFDAIGVDRSTARHNLSRVPILPSLNDFDGKPFDAITLFEVLEHLDHPGEMLDALRGHLKSGGILVLETPDCTGVTSIRSAREYHLIHPLEHINAFTHDTLESIATRRGFEVISRPAAIVSPTPGRAMKRIAKHLTGCDGRSTQLYFRKV